MVHAPAATSVTVLPLTVQTPALSEAKLTASPDDALADTVKGGSPRVLSARAAKVR